MDVVLARLGGRLWAVPTARVREVTQVGNITPVPQAPAAIVGLMQLRGNILPVIDLDGTGERTLRPGDPLLVVEEGAVRAALSVDQVVAVATEPGGAELLDVGALFDRVRGHAPEALP